MDGHRTHAAHLPGRIWRIGILYDLECDGPNMFPLLVCEVVWRQLGALGLPAGDERHTERRAGLHRLAVRLHLDIGPVVHQPEWLPGYLIESHEGLPLWPLLSGGEAQDVTLDLVPLPHELHGIHGWPALQRRQVQQPVHQHATTHTLQRHTLRHGRSAHRRKTHTRLWGDGSVFVADGSDEPTSTARHLLGPHVGLGGLLGGLGDVHADGRGVAAALAQHVGRRHLQLRIATEETGTADRRAMQQIFAQQL
mmetsp:Transcript_36731/g.92049  ORF Transcript_36731/g.92049 Transcript_36731/m.92049 type:complete len:252 (+) Transcript_36731:693-1448(+)